MASMPPRGVGHGVTSMSLVWLAYSQPGSMASEAFRAMPGCQQYDGLALSNAADRGGITWSATGRRHKGQPRRKATARAAMRKRSLGILAYLPHARLMKR